MRPTWLAVLAGLTLSAGPLAAQRLEPNRFPSAGFTFSTEAPRTPLPHTGVGAAAVSSSGSVGGMILGGVGLGAAGFLGGALAGDRFQSTPCEDCIEGAFYGGLAGESLAIPIGVHLADHRRGKLAPALAASLGIGALGLGAAALTDEWGILLAVPVLQLGASIGIERHTAGRQP